MTFEFYISSTYVVTHHYI